MSGSQAAGVGVLDDGDRRSRKIGCRCPGGIGIKDIVEGQLFAPELFGPCDAGILTSSYALLGVESRRLMRVLAVA